jgi:mRNA interferase MazF
MKRGEIWWVNFGPSIGGEIRKPRPAIIVSNNSANKFLNRVQVVPLTRSVGRLYPSEAFVTLDGERCKAMADQITTVSKRRLTNKAGIVSQRELKEVARAIKAQLNLS